MMVSQVPVEGSSSLRPAYTDRLRSFEGFVKGVTQQPDEHSPSAALTGSGENAMLLSFLQPPRGNTKGIGSSPWRAPAAQKMTIDPVPGAAASANAAFSQWVPDQTGEGESAGTVNYGNPDAFSEPAPVFPAPELRTGGPSALLQGSAFGIQESLFRGISHNETGKIKGLVGGLPEGILQHDALKTGSGYPGKIRELLFELGCPLSDAARGGKPADSGLAETATGDAPQGLLKNLLPRLGISPEESGKLRAMASDSDSMPPETGEMGSTLHNGIRKLLLQVGLSSREVEEIMGDKTAFSGLSKALFKSGNPDALSSAPVAQQGMARDLKTYLLTQGIDPGKLEYMFAAGGSGNTSVSSGDGVTLLFQEAEHLADGTHPSITGNEGQDAATKGAGDTSDWQKCMVSFLSGGQPVAGESSAGCEQLPLPQSHDGVTQKVVEQVVSGIKIQLEHGQAEARISLHPPSLGKVHMHIVTRENQVRATFFAETPHVKEIIESNFPKLRESFLEQGMHVEHFSVFVGNQPSGNQAGGYAPSSEGISCQGLREVPEQEDIPAPEHAAGRAARDHMVDLFI
jgi:hypothetical protein